MTILALANPPYMAYCVWMMLTDYRGFKIELSDEAMEHIRKGHAEITVAVISETMVTPDEVRKSTQVKPSSKCTAELYYRRKSIAAGQVRWNVVVVKLCPDGNYVTSAYTAESLKQGDVVYPKPKKRVKK
jgi:hypothetical protein